MTKTQAEQMKRVDQFCSGVITGYPSLFDFTACLSNQDLIYHLVQSYCESRRGKPLSPPLKFVAGLRQVVPDPDWKLRLGPLRNSISEKERLSRREADYLALGLLWETLLVLEWKRRPQHF